MDCEHRLQSTEIDELSRYLCEHDFAALKFQFICWISHRSPHFTVYLSFQLENQYRRYCGLKNGVKQRGLLRQNITQRYRVPQIWQDVG